MTNSISRSKSGIDQLQALHNQMDEGDHVRGDLRSVYVHSGKAKVDPSKYLNIRHLSKEWEYARGYDGIKQVVANSVGKAKADEIMKAILPGRGRRPSLRFDDLARSDRPGPRLGLPTRCLRPQLLPGDVAVESPSGLSE